MGNLIASCGHPIKDFEAPNSFTVTTFKNTNGYIAIVNNNKTEYYIELLCLKCFKQNRKKGIINNIYNKNKMRWIPIKKYRIPKAGK
jgi:hypothetical protein